MKMFLSSYEDDDDERVDAEQNIREKKKNKDKD